VTIVAETLRANAGAGSWSLDDEILEFKAIAPPVLLTMMET